MSLLTCVTCANDWAASIRPCCPSCLVSSWLSSPNLISEKHHPESLSRPLEQYRSVVTPEVATNLRTYLDAAVTSGTWYFNTEFEKFNHVTRLPLDQKPGSGVDAGKLQPNRRLEDLVIADADRDPHLFADDREETRRKITSGIYIHLEACARSGCDNLVQPRSRECAIHMDRPVATRRMA
jgi:hypothetical protein